MYDRQDTRHAPDQRAIEGAPAQPDQKPQDQGLFANGLRQTKRLVVLVVGGTILLVGVVMLVIPGPGLIVIPLGLGILAIEFAWARRLLGKFKEKGTDFRNAFGGRKTASSAKNDSKNRPADGGDKP